MNTRRFNVARLCLAMCLTAGAAVQAADTNQYDEGQLVPFAEYTSGGNLTAVGLISKSDGTVYWAFFDVDGNRRANGSLSILADDLVPFIWSASTPGAATLSNVPGFLVFGLDSNGNGQVTAADDDALGANAFYIVPPNDVAYVPTVDIGGSQLTDPTPANWTDNPVAALPFLNTGDDVDLQYWIDGASGGEDSTLFIWTARKMASSQNMTINDGAGTSKAITVQFLDDNLNLIDLETNPQVTSGFYGDGFVRWAIPNANDAAAVDVMMFSMAISPTFGAIQTLMPNWD